MSKQSAGGKARAAKLTKEARSQIAKDAAQRRWHKGEKIRAPDPEDGFSFVYGFGPEDGPLKIGYSANVAWRRQTLQASHHQKLVLWFAHRIATSDVIVAERKAHRALAESHVKGEWFRASPDEAELAVKRAISEVEAGDRSIPKLPQRDPITLRLPPALHDKVKAQAHADGVSMHDVVLAAVGRSLGASVQVVAAPAPKSQPARATLDTSMVPELGTFERGPMQKTKAAPRRKW